MIHLAPQESTGYWRHGTILLAMRESDLLRRHALARDALRDAEEAVRFAPENADSLTLLAEAHCACGQFAEAEQAAKTLLNLYPDWSWTCKLMGDVYRQQKHLRVAESFYHKAVAEAKDDANVINDVGLAFWEIGCREAARNCFDRAHQMRPDDPTFRFNRVRFSPWKLLGW
jgi:tetratricopeptide (TPR) repeat protein